MESDKISHSEKMQTKYEQIMGKIAKLSFVCFFCFLFLIASQSIYDSRKADNAICTPTTYFRYPMIPIMPAINEQNMSSELYMFVEQYVHDVYNETIVDYQKPSKYQRRSYTYLKMPLMRAIMHSKGQSQIDNKVLLTKSSDRYRELKDKNTGYIFNIQAIESYKRSGDKEQITVLGEFQKTADKMHSDMDHEFWGYRRIYLTVVRGAKNLHKNPSLQNNSGFYVIHQDIQILPDLAKDKLFNLTYSQDLHVE